MVKRRRAAREDSRDRSIDPRDVFTRPAEKPGVFTSFVTPTYSEWSVTPMKSIGVSIVMSYPSGCLMVWPCAYLYASSGPVMRFPKTHLRLLLRFRTRGCREHAAHATAIVMTVALFFMRCFLPRQC